MLAPYRIPSTPPDRPFFPARIPAPDFLDIKLPSWWIDCPKREALYTFVRSVGAAVTWTGTVGSLVVGASGVAAGDLVTVAFFNNAATASTSVTDNHAATTNVWTRAAGSAGNACNVELYSCRITTALVSGDHIDANFGTSQTGSIAALEFAGGTGNSVRVSAAATSASGGSPPAALVAAKNTDIVVILTGIKVSDTLDANPPPNYTAGATKPTSVPSIYMDYSIMAADANRSWTVNVWGNQVSAMGTVNVAIYLTPPTPWNPLKIQTTYDVPPSYWQPRRDFAVLGSPAVPVLMVPNDPLPVQQSLLTYWQPRRDFAIFDSPVLPVLTPYVVSEPPQVVPTYWQPPPPGVRPPDPIVPVVPVPYMPPEPQQVDLSYWQPLPRGVRQPDAVVPDVLPPYVAPAVQQAILTYWQNPELVAAVLAAAYSPNVVPYQPFVVQVVPAATDQPPRRYVVFPPPPVPDVAVPYAPPQLREIPLVTALPLRVAIGHLGMPPAPPPPSTGGSDLIYLLDSGRFAVRLDDDVYLEI